MKKAIEIALRIWVFYMFTAVAAKPLRFPFSYILIPVIFFILFLSVDLMNRRQKLQIVQDGMLVHGNVVCTRERSKFSSETHLNVKFVFQTQDGASHSTKIYGRNPYKSEGIFPDSAYFLDGFPQTVVLQDTTIKPIDWGGVIFLALFAAVFGYLLSSSNSIPIEFSFG